jgi:hypothetical protein
MCGRFQGTGVADVDIADMAMYRLSAPTNEENRQIQRKGGIDYAVWFSGEGRRM